MKTYEHYTQSPDGWNVTATLELKDDGRFGYSEGWTDYTNASLSGGARGTWRRSRAGIVFHAEWAEGPMYFPWEVGKSLTAIEQDGALEFPQGWTLSLPSEYILKTPVSNTGTKPPALPQVSGAETAKPADKLLVTSSPAPSPTHAPVAPQFEPRAPSPELAARIRQWIDELPTEGMENWIGRLCKENDAIPLHCSRFDLWVLQPDGQVLSIDHDSFARRAEPETNAEVAYDMLALGAETHPELWELFPPEHRGERRSE